MEKIRLNKFLQQTLKISRRNADELIRQGEIKVDGQVAAPGMVIDPVRQKVVYRGKRIRWKPPKFSYYIFHKPAGYICSRAGYRTIYEVIPRQLRFLDYVGRLDVATSGLLLMTDDGDLAQKIVRSSIPRVYEVELDSSLDEPALAVLRDGPFLDGRRVAVGSVEADGPRVVIELFEGRWRAVRRIFAAMGYEVKSLRRIALGPIELGDLPEGEMRSLSREELRKLREAVEKSSGDT